MVSANIRAIQADQDDRATLNALSLLLDQPGQAALVAGDQRVEIPESILDVIQQAADILCAGGAVSIIPYDTALTTQQAADFLGVSRPYLISILDDEGIEYSYVGTHRRIALSEIDRYRQRRDAERRNVLDAMTRDAFEMGLYDVGTAQEESAKRGS